MSIIDDLLANNEVYARSFDGSLPAAPIKQVAVVACMDARLDVHRILGLREGEAHVIRNAGGVVSDDVIRSLVISQRRMGTTEIMLIQHTGCGMRTFTDEEFNKELHEDVGMTPTWAAETFTDLESNLRQSIARIVRNPFVSHTGSVRGFVFDVETGRLAEVSRYPTDQ